MFVTLLLLCAAPLTLVAARARFYRAWLIRARPGGASDLTGRRAALELLRIYRVQGVSVRYTPAPLGDHYNPAARSLCLSRHVYSQASLAAVAVAAHEVGHAVQYRDGYPPLRLQEVLGPLLQAGNGALFFAVALGYVFQMPGLAWAGALGFGCLTPPCLVTLLVELDASRRAHTMLLEAHLVAAAERDRLSAFLRLAWSTYLAACLVVLSAAILSALVASNALG